VSCSEYEGIINNNINGKPTRPRARPASASPRLHRVSDATQQQQTAITSTSQPTTPLRERNAVRAHRARLRGRNAPPGRRSADATRRHIKKKNQCAQPKVARNFRLPAAPRAKRPPQPRRSASALGARQRRAAHLGKQQSTKRKGCQNWETQTATQRRQRCAHRPSPKMARPRGGVESRPSEHDRRPQTNSRIKRRPKSLPRRPPSSTRNNRARHRPLPLPAQAPDATRAARQCASVYNRSPRRAVSDGVTGAARTGSNGRRNLAAASIQQTDCHRRHSSTYRDRSTGAHRQCTCAPTFASGARSAASSPRSTSRRHRAPQISLSDCPEPARTPFDPRARQSTFRVLPSPGAPVGARSDTGGGRGDRRQFEANFSDLCRRRPKLPKVPQQYPPAAHTRRSLLLVPQTPHAPSTSAPAPPSPPQAAPRAAHAVPPHKRANLTRQANSPS